MKRQIIFAILLAAATAAVSLGQTVDNRPLIYPHYLNQKDFADLGLWFWVNDSHHPPTDIWVDWIKGEENGPLQRSFVCVGKLGSNVPIYCVNAPTERDDTLIMKAFLQGYKAGQLDALNKISAN
jgi:hypothetical protein